MYVHAKMPKPTYSLPSLAHDFVVNRAVVRSLTPAVIQTLNHVVNDFASDVSAVVNLQPNEPVVLASQLAQCVN